MRWCSGAGGGVWRGQERPPGGPADTKAIAKNRSHSPSSTGLKNWNIYYTSGPCIMFIVPPKLCSVHWCAWVNHSLAASPPPWGSEAVFPPCLPRQLRVASKSYLSLYCQDLAEYLTLNGCSFDAEWAKECLVFHFKNPSSSQVLWYFDRSSVKELWYHENYSRLGIWSTNLRKTWGRSRNISPTFKAHRIGIRSQSLCWLHQSTGGRLQAIS